MPSIILLKISLLSFPEKACCPVNNSYVISPKDHKSILFLQASFGSLLKIDFTISGAILLGQSVINDEPEQCFPSFLDKSKSEIFKVKLSFKVTSEYFTFGGITPPTAIF